MLCQTQFYFSDLRFLFYAATQLCDLPDHRISPLVSCTHASCFFLDPVQSVNLSSPRAVTSSSGIIFVFEENKATKVTCKVTGGYPPPAIKIYRDDIDISMYFTQKVFIHCSCFFYFISS